MGKCIKTYKYYAHVAKIMAKKEMHKREPYDIIDLSSGTQESLVEREEQRNEKTERQCTGSAVGSDSS